MQNANGEDGLPAAPFAAGGWIGPGTAHPPAAALFFRRGLLPRKKCATITGPAFAGDQIGPRFPHEYP